VSLDVTDPAAAEAAVRTAAETFGRLDVVVNNAGYADLVSVEDITLADFRAQIETNLMGVVNVTKAARPALREQGAGHIVQISSVGALSGLFGAGDVPAAGDPGKVAAVVLAVTDLPDPPVRPGRRARRAESDARRHDLSVSTDHDEATEAELRPLG
jgi:NAD(P)-dependent dehydrogenase (short-subunit alcohol dehydrogenase family)